MRPGLATVVTVKRPDMLRHRTPGRIRAKLRSYLREQVLERFHGDGDLAAEQIDRGGETGEQHKFIAIRSRQLSVTKPR